jgi:quinol monooxygenase YgiN
MLMYTGKFSIEPSERESFLEFVREMVADERKVVGCISFDIYEDVLERNTFLLVEQWEDAASLEAHTETDAYADNDDTLNNYVSGEPVWEEYEF